VAAGLFVIVTPTLLFLALWRGLQAMADDELVRRVQQRAGEGAPGSPVTSPVSPGSAVACRTCGASNRAGTAYCQQCLSPLPD